MTWVERCVPPAIAAVLVAALTGCGMPAAPSPPSLNLAIPVSDLAAVRTGDEVRLTWTMPTKNTDKLLLKGDVDIRVCRAQSEQQPCVQAGSLKLARAAAGSFSEELPQELATGMPRALTYSVVLMNRNGRSAGPSNPAVVLAGEAPAAVQDLEAKVRKEGVVLRWKAEALGPQATAIRLQRKLLTPVEKPQAAQGPLAPPPEAVDQNLLVELGQNGIARDATVDRTIRFGAAYEYRAQRVIRVTVGDQAMELDGPLSAPVRVEAADVFPPDIPQGLVAVAVPAENSGAPAIDLNWQPNTETDLAGYIVYRREQGGEWRRISPAPPVIGPGFHDAHVAVGHTYEYAVSAIDQGGHESSRSAVARETVPDMAPNP